MLADHGRAMTMLAADGVHPVNESRGYILRRIIRRAVAARLADRAREPVPRPPAGSRRRAARRRSIPRSSSTATMCAALLEAEEERFRATLADGLGAARRGHRAHARRAGATTIAGGGRVPAARHLRLPGRADRRARRRGRAWPSTRPGSPSSWRSSAGAPARRPDAAAAADPERLATFAREAGFAQRVRRLPSARTSRRPPDAVEDLGEGRLLVKLRASPFYAEGGGQVSDHGTIESDGGRAAVERGASRFDGDQALIVRARARHAAAPARRCGPASSRAPRAPTVANHTGHAPAAPRAAQAVLGDHVRQRGSSVRPDKLRFDFSHPSAADGGGAAGGRGPGQPGRRSRTAPSASSRRRRTRRASSAP